MKLLVLWPDPSFLQKNVYMLNEPQVCQGWTSGLTVWIVYPYRPNKLHVSKLQIRTPNESRMYTI